MYGGPLVPHIAPHIAVQMASGASEHPAAKPPIIFEAGDIALMAGGPQPAQTINSMETDLQRTGLIISSRERFPRVNTRVGSQGEWGQQDRLHGHQGDPSISGMPVEGKRL